jgi:deoxyribose-phosphate aldolase
MESRKLASRIDHTLLKADAVESMIDRLCDEAIEHEFAAVCVNPIWVTRCADRLADTKIAVATVAGFPLGASQTDVKVAEAVRAVEDGATEIDMVLRVGDLIAGETGVVQDDIAAVVEAVHERGRRNLVKVILETAALTPEQIAAGCRCAAAVGADYVKTSTGFHPAGGATIEAVKLLRQHGQPARVKAAGGIRDAATAIAMVEAGASRIGCSTSVSIVAG